MLEITKRLELTAAPQRVWKAITDPRELASWFPDRAADFKPEAGYEGTFTWALKDESDACTGGAYAMKVEVSEPFERLVWSWAREAGVAFGAGLTTRVEWTLTPRPGGGTVLELRETGFESTIDRDRNDGGWDHELGELVSWLESQAADRGARKSA